MVKSRLHATAIHLAVSVAVAALAASVVFLFWYPYPYSKISGGMKMFMLLIAIDIVVGPVLTLVIFTPQKTRRALVFDFSIIGILQIVALVYGLWSLSIARPTYLVFENSQFTIVRAIDVPAEQGHAILAALQGGSKIGPKMVALRPFRDAREQFDVTMDALGGVPLATRTELWQPFEASVPMVLQVARPISNSPRFSALLAVNRPDLVQKGLRYLPLQGAQGFWTAILDENARIVDFVELEPFD